MMNIVEEFYAWEAILMMCKFVIGLAHIIHVYLVQSSLPSNKFLTAGLLTRGPAHHQRLFGPLRVEFPICKIACKIVHILPPYKKPRFSVQPNSLYMSLQNFSKSIFLFNPFISLLQFPISYNLVSFRFFAWSHKDEAIKWRPSICVCPKIKQKS